MKKILFAIFSTLLLISCSDELKFVCTEISYTGSDMSPKEIQRDKAKHLGSEVTLIFYDNSVKLCPEGSNKRDESMVLDKVYSDEYRYNESKRSGDYYCVDIKLEKWFGYIRSFTLDAYKNGNLQGTATYKRDEWLEEVIDFFNY